MQQMHSLCTGWLSQLPGFLLRDHGFVRFGSARFSSNAAMPGRCLWHLFDGSGLPNEDSSLEHGKTVPEGARSLFDVGQ